MITKRTNIFRNVVWRMNNINNDVIRGSRDLMKTNATTGDVSLTQSVVVSGCCLCLSVDLSGYCSSVSYYCWRCGLVVTRWLRST